MTKPAFRPAAVGLAVFIIGLVLLVLDPGGVFNRLREEAFDLIEVHVPPKRQSEGVLVIDIDRASLAEKGSWPWRRAVLADLIGRVRQANPKVIGVDILLQGADRRAPAPLLRALAREGGRQDLLAIADSLPDDDKQLGQAMAGADIVLGFLLDDAGTDMLPFPAPILAMGGARPLASLAQAARGIASPLPVLADRATALGALSLAAGAGGRVRGVPLFVRAGDEVFAGFAMEVFRLAQGASSFVLEADGETVSVGANRIAMQRNASVRVHLAPPEDWALRTVSAGDVLDGKVPPDRIAGHVVLIGSSAPEAGALLATAVSPLTPTVQIQAEAVEALKEGDAPWRWRGLSVVEPVAATGLGLLALGAALWFGPMVSILTQAGLALAWAGSSVLLFSAAGVLVDPVGPLLPAIAASNCALVLMFAHTRKLRGAIERKFGRYLSPEIVQRLAAAPEELRIEGELREVTALFTDIEGFTSISETAEPRVLVSVLDAYFEGVCGIVIRHGGMIDKIVGDAVHALFNAPLDLPRHADAALDCAVEIQRFTTHFRKRDDAAALGFGRTRIGIETGPVIVGDVGGLGHLDYTAHGDAVNSAARLEAIDKRFGTGICLGPRAAAAIGDPGRLRPLGAVILRGRTAETAVFSPWPDDAAPERRQHYLEAFAERDRDAEKAGVLFARLARDWPSDPAVSYWVRALAARDLTPRGL